MVKPTPTLEQRAAGALIGHAAGSRATAPAGEPGRRADVAFAVILAEELLGTPVDLRRIAGRWADWVRDDGAGAGERTRAALSHFDAYGTPPERSEPSAAANTVSWCLPVALATTTSPRNLVSGTYHVAALTHPEPVAAWAAVAVNVAAGRLLSGYRDFVPEVLDVLRANEAPAVLVETVRRVPLLRQAALAAPASAVDAAATMGVALWMAYHEPILERGLDWLAAPGRRAPAAALAAGLMGARDGEAALGTARVAALEDAPLLRHLAEHLVARR